MDNILPYALPLISGLGVTIAALVVKRATQEGIGVTRIQFLLNWIFLALLIPITLIFSDGIHDTSRWWTISVAALGMFLGGTFILVSIRCGDVSVQTPLMGAKVIFVATFTLFTTSVTTPLSWWIAAGLTFFGILILGAKELLTCKHSKRSILFALLACAALAMTDIVVATEAPKFGILPYLTFTVGIAAILGFSLLPFFKKDLFTISKTAWTWAIGAAGLVAVQHAILLITLSIYGNPTAVNIIHSSRGIWSIAIIWFAGHWFGNTERHSVGSSGMTRRLIGALMIFAAIVIVILK